jgi:hypothetical protein
MHLVPTLRVGTELCDALRRGRQRWGEVDDRVVNQPTRSVENVRSHAERGNEITNDV